eukprot:scaffold44_cov411-Prasinococcus_capsulatus_cf.AAC.17
MLQSTYPPRSFTKARRPRSTKGAALGGACLTRSQLVPRTGPVRMAPTAEHLRQGRKPRRPEAARPAIASADPIPIQARARTARMPARRERRPSSSAAARAPRVARHDRAAGVGGRLEGRGPPALRRPARDGCTSETPARVRTRLRGGVGRQGGWGRCHCQWPTGAPARWAEPGER